MADYANDIITQKRIEQRNKTADFQLKQYTDRLGFERRRRASDFDREKRIFQKRYMFLRTAVKGVARYSEQVDEFKDLKNGNIRRQTLIAPNRAVKSAATIQQKLEDEMTGNDIARAALKSAGNNDVFITQRASARQGNQSPRKSVVDELDADEDAVFVSNNERDDDTWSSVARDLQYIAGPEVIERVHINKTYGPRNIGPRATASKGRPCSASAPNSGKKKQCRPFTGHQFNNDRNNGFSYEQFNLKRPDTSKLQPKDVSFIKYSLDGTKTPRLPVHVQTLGKKNITEGKLLSQETQAHLSIKNERYISESKDNQGVQFLEVPGFTGTRSRKSSINSFGDYFDAASYKSDYSSRRRSRSHTLSSSYGSDK